MGYCRRGAVTGHMDELCEGDLAPFLATGKPRSGEVWRQKVLMSPHSVLEDSDRLCKSAAERPLIGRKARQMGISGLILRKCALTSCNRMFGTADYLPKSRNLCQSLEIYESAEVLFCPGKEEGLKSQKYLESRICKGPAFVGQ